MQANAMENDQNDYEAGVAFHACSLVISMEKMTQEGISIYKINERPAKLSKVVLTIDCRGRNLLLWWKV
jgi:hypothetical protein